MIMKATLRQKERRLRILLTESLILTVLEAKQLLEGFKLYEPIKTFFFGAKTGWINWVSLLCSSKKKVKKDIKGIVLDYWFFWLSPCPHSQVHGWRHLVWPIGQFLLLGY